MINFMIRLRGYLLLFLAIIYLIYIFTGWFASLFIIVVALLVFIVSFPFMSPLPRLMAFIMIGIGQFLFFWYGGTWAYWSEAIIKNLPLVALFVTVPLLSIPLRTGGYVAYMVSVMRRFFKTPVMIHTAIAGCALILTSFINLGSVRVLDELFGSELRRKKSLSVKAITQGFSLAAMMSPYIAGVAIVLYLLEVSFIPFLFYGMFMAVCGIGISMGLNFLAFRNTTLPAQESAASNDTRTFQGSDANDERTKGKGAQLFLAFVGLFIAIFLLEEWLQINLIVIISLVAIVYPFLWVFLIRGRKLLPDYLQNYFKEVLPNVHNESVLIVGAAFFSAMVQLTPFPEELSRLFRSLHDYSVFLTVFIVLVVIVGLSLFGIHQILPITVLASSVSAQSIGLPPTLYALTLTVSWGLVTSVSPISAMNIVSCQLFRLNSWQLGKWNWQYAGTMIIFTTIVVSLFNLLL